jgi:hypothetical protein
MSERTQVKLVLTKDPEILNALRRNGILRNAGTEKEHLALQFDSQHFHFYPNKELVVPETVAESLYRSSGILVSGDAMGGSQVPSLVVVEKWVLGEQEPSRVASKTTCSVCGVDQKTFKALAAHLAAEHAEEETEEEGK